MCKGKKFLVAVGLWLVLPVLALAGDLKITGALVVPQYGAAELKPDGVDVKGAGFIWDVSPRPVWSRELPDGSLYFSGAPATYSAKLRVVRFADGKVSIETVEVKVTVGDGGGDDGNDDSKPKPKPKPPNPPGPVAPDKMFVVVVEETSASVATRGLMFSDRDLLARMADKGHRWRVIDQNVVDVAGNVPADVARFVADAKSKKLPQVYVVDSKGVTRASGELPAVGEPKFVLDLLTKNGG